MISIFISSIYKGQWFDFKLSFKTVLGIQVPSSLYFEYIFIQINIISKHKFEKEFNLLLCVILGIFEENTLLKQVELNKECTL